MPIQEYASGSATIDDTEWSLTNNSSTIASETSPGVYQLIVSYAMIGPFDNFVLRLYEKITSSANQTVFMSVHLPPGVNRVWTMPAIILLHGWDFTLQNVGGTDRTFSWSIRRVF